MKRLVWLLLAVFCTALAQVQPVQLPATSDVSCPCCDIPGGCDTPDCGLPPPSGQTGLLAEQAAPLTVSVARHRAAHLGRVAMEFAFFSDAGSAFSISGNSSPSPLAPSAVPLFKVHCSFLI